MCKHACVCMCIATSVHLYTNQYNVATIILHFVKQKVQVHVSIYIQSLAKTQLSEQLQMQILCNQPL